jgi:hypothetical protein
MGLDPPGDRRRTRRGCSGRGWQIQFLNPDLAGIDGAQFRHADHNTWTSMKTFLLLLAIGIAALAQSGLDVPQAGLMVDHSGALRVVTGIAQSFIAGGAVRTGVLSAACGRALCLAKTDTLLFDARNPGDPGISSPAGPAFFAVRNQSALLYFPAVRQCARFKDGQLEMLDWSVDGEVLALRATSDGPRFAVRRADGVWIIALDGSLESALPPGTVAVLLVDGATVYSLPDAVVLRRTDGSETPFSLSGVTSFSQLSENYVQVSTSSGIYALRTDLGREQLSLLPDSVGASQ